MFLSDKNLKTAFAPVDLNTAGAVGSRVSLAKHKKVAIVLNIGTSLTGGIVDISLKQHDAASAGTSKALAITGKYHKKVGTATKFTEVAIDTAEDNFVLSTDFDTLGGLVVFEVNVDEIDVNGGFSHVSVELADGGVAKLASAIYVLSDADEKPAYKLDV